MIAIEKAWDDNLKLSKEDQWESKQDIMENYCPNSCEIGLDLKEPKYCSEEYDEEKCTRCWNRTIEEDKLTFNKLEISPISNINLDGENEEDIKESLKRNDYIICVDNSIDYNKIPQLIKWLQDVYNYCTELKSNLIEYVDFETAKKWMYDNNGVAECEGVLYDNSGMFSLEVTYSNKWILIKNE